MSEMVPEGWTKIRLSEFSSARRGTTYVASELSEDKERYPLYINMKSFKVGGGYNESGDKYFSSPYLPRQVVRENDLLIANTDVTDACDILGAAVYLPREKLLEDVLFSHHVSALNIANDVDVNFLSFLFGSETSRLEMKRCGRGTTVKMLDIKDIGRICFSIPPLSEQKKIASILTSVDEVIETTQKQIDKLQDLKKATMNELLTKGIGHTEFKDSELGRIPKSWEVKKLGETGKWKGGGTPSKSNPEFWEGNIPWVSPKDMKYEYISQTEDYVSDLAVANSSTNLIDSGAILIVVRSGILKHTLPVAISKCNLTINQDMKALSVSKKFSNLFIYHYLVAKNHVVLRSTLKAGNTVESIDTQVFSDYLIPTPPLHEQIAIANIIETIASQIRKKNQKLSQTQSLKKSLMQDLLTGKVRVQVN